MRVIKLYLATLLFGSRYLFLRQTRKVVKTVELAFICFQLFNRRIAEAKQKENILTLKRSKIL